MANVFDVASYILQKKGLITTWKLQKLVYYCQAWSLAWEGKEMFPEEIEAWANGPVVRKLYEVHRGEYEVDRLKKGDSEALTEEQRSTVNAVLDFYGNRTPQWLSDLTHMEDPWRLARKRMPDGVRGDSIISKESLDSYYGNLYRAQAAE